MKFYLFLNFLLLVNSFVPKQIFPKKNLILQNKKNNLFYKNKINDIVELTRIKKNFIPVTLVSLIGGFVVNPNTWQIWINSPPYFAALSMLQIITSASMIINDIYDIKVDKINNPNRPLIKGTISVKEAKGFSIILLSIYSYLGLRYLPPILDPIWTSSILLITLYTPIFKKIFFIKNLTCAFLISLSLPFMAIATFNPLLNKVPNLILLYLSMKIFFLGSLYIEILLDIIDKKGDKEIGINTLPVVLGNKLTLNILIGLLILGNFNIIIDSIKLNINLLPSIVSFLPLYYNLFIIKYNNFNKIVIKEAICKIKYSLIIYLITIFFI